MPPPSGATPFRCHPLQVPPPTSTPVSSVGPSPPCPAGWQGWLTEGAVLGHSRALLLALGAGLADLTLEGGEEVLAELLGHISLQVGLHEEAEALVVDGLGSGQRRRRMEVPQGTLRVQGGRGASHSEPPSLGTPAAEPSPKQLASQIPGAAGDLQGPRGSRNAQGQQCWEQGQQGRSWGSGRKGQSTGTFQHSPMGTFLLLRTLCLLLLPCWALPSCEDDVSSMVLVAPAGVRVLWCPGVKGHLCAPPHHVQHTDFSHFALILVVPAPWEGSVLLAH